MKLFSEFVELLENDKQPMYMAVRPDPTTIAYLQQVIKDHNIPSPHSAEKMHCTLIYSRTPTPIPQCQTHRIYKANLSKFDVFNTQDGKRCLVAKLSSPDLIARHNELMIELDASYDHPTYLPHITLSYDIGDLDISVLNQSVTLNPMYLLDEYYEILNDLA